MRKDISQEGLKGIASVTMLIDHIGATLVYALYLAAWEAKNYPLMGSVANVYELTRIIGRIAFPIYCFLLVEGFCHTRDLKKYMMRLGIGALLSEIPFDLALHGHLDWTDCSVMVTMLLGCLMMLAMQRSGGLWRIALAIPFALAAELLDTDYGAHGIAIIALMYLTRGLPREKLLRTVGLAVLLWFGATVQIGPLEIPMEEFALIGLIPMFCYSGRKLTRNKWVQWGFYLFYPVHLLVLWILETLIFA